MFLQVPGSVVLAHPTKAMSSQASFHQPALQTSPHPTRYSETPQPDPAIIFIAAREGKYRESLTRHQELFPPFPLQSQLGSGFQQLAYVGGKQQIKVPGARASGKLLSFSPERTAPCSPRVVSPSAVLGSWHISHCGIKTVDNHYCSPT